MKKVLLDTSVIIDFLHQKNKADTLLYKLSTEDLYISIVTHTELYSGKSVWEKTRAKQELNDLFSGLTILPLVTEVSEKAGYLKATNQGTLLDCIIAATALHHNIPLLTLNSKDFKQIKKLKLFEA